MPPLLALALLAGCGKGSDGEQITDLVERQADAGRTNNTTDLCEGISARAKAEIASAAKALRAKGTDCATQLAVVRAADEDPEPVAGAATVMVTDIEVRGDRATARISPVGAGADPVARFVREDGNWKADAPPP